MGDVCHFKIFVIWSVILWAISSFPIVFICSPCLVKCSLCLSLCYLYIHVFILLYNFLLYVVTSLLTHDVDGRSCLFGALTMIILVSFLCFTKFEMCTRPFLINFLLCYLHLPRPQLRLPLSIVNLLSRYICNYL
jgi:hypothetical protein